VPSTGAIAPVGIWSGPLASVNVKLSADEITSLEEPYVPHAVVGFV